MSCIFCCSLHHISQNCDSFVSNGDRKVAAQTRKLCEECLSKTCVSPTSTHPLPKCNTLNICRLCYSKKHNTIFCPDKATAPNFFIPNVDKDLLPRFLAMLDTDERQLLAFHSPAILDLCTLRPLKIVDTLYIGSLDNYSGPNIITCKNFELYYFRSLPQYQTSFKNIGTKIWDLYVEKLKITSSSTFACYLYVLLSSRTKFLVLKLVTFVFNITLDEIFKKAPNLEEFEYEFGDSNDDNATRMLNKNFFKNSYGKKFKRMKITLYNKNFNVEYLIPFLEKNTTNVQIDVYVNVPLHLKNTGEKFMTEISKYFVPSSSSPYLSVYIEKWENWKNSFEFVGTFSLHRMHDYDVVLV